MDTCTAHHGHYQDLHDAARAAGRYCEACEFDLAFPDDPAETEAENRRIAKAAR